MGKNGLALFSAGFASGSAEDGGDPQLIAERKTISIPSRLELRSASVHRAARSCGYGSTSCGGLRPTCRHRRTGCAAYRPHTVRPICCPSAQAPAASR